MTTFVVFLLVLGLLIFFHEMGHFLAAKACGVYVDRFSLGMPPRIAGFKWGDTDYCLGALPIGGYVKMAGQEDAPRSEEEQLADYAHVPKEQWFNNRPIWQRYIIIVGGPAMNIVLALILYAIAAGVGDDVEMYKVDNRVGRIDPGLPAAAAPMWEIEGDDTQAETQSDPDATGWQTGDRILSVDGEQVRAIIPDLAMAAVLGGKGAREIVIERTEDDGTTQRYLSRITPAPPKEPDRNDFPQFGVAPYDTALINTVLAGEPADEAGLKPGDRVIMANGKPIEKQSLTEFLRANAGNEVNLVVDRDGEEVDITVTPRHSGRLLDVLVTPNISIYAYINESEEPAAKSAEMAAKLGVSPGAALESIDGEDASWATIKSWLDGAGDEVSLSFAGGKTIAVPAKEALQLITGYDTDAQLRVAESADEEFGLRRHDRIIHVNGEPATVGALRAIEESSPGETITLTIERDPVLFGLLREQASFDVEVPVQEVGAIGIIYGVETVFHSYPLAEVIPEAVSRSVQDVNRVFDTLYMLFTGQISAKNLGGPVMIYQATASQWQAGMIWLLQITAFISVNLAVFNLLPLPVLDGGQCVLLAIEAIRRKPLDVFVVERIQQVGVLFIIFLMLYVTKNDIQRLVEGYLG